MSAPLPFDVVHINGPQGVIEAKLDKLLYKTFLVRLGTPATTYEFFLLSGKSRKLGDRYIVREDELVELRKARTR